ncbi:hypothetical protein [Streptomyces cinerochromogenes]|uniref:hypothetical protein n=1 Tax=Streptomyces cinerochromogenes TaxID=66422 RepID=UPI00166F98EE|nr:hypothetical protein [Streptomyces cinerochromogenes]
MTSPVGPGQLPAVTGTVTAGLSGRTSRAVARACPATSGARCAEQLAGSPRSR